MIARGKYQEIDKLGTASAVWKAYYLFLYLGKEKLNLKKARRNLAFNSLPAALVFGASLVAGRRLGPLESLFYFWLVAHRLARVVKKAVKRASRSKHFIVSYY